jgi:mannitol-1-/sugar-/sorbitol-6-/2-deoxyglucose-6-phosphatase
LELEIITGEKRICINFKSMISKTEREIKAVIFDMDGVIIDSETIWKKAEKKVFSSVGVELTEELCEITQSMTTSEVTKFWFDKQPWKNISLVEVENEVIKQVAHLITHEGTLIKGADKLIKELKTHGYKIGLATNSPSVLISVVLEKFKLEDYFDAYASAEYEPAGKPNPYVYLTVARKLNLKPERCIVIEDSCPGLEAAKNAGMKTIAFLNDAKRECQIADFKINDFIQFDFSFLN